ncbi:hypothtical protein [Rhodotorula toruloides]|uniref:Hypothtical protein n=1 Tax=Rhodotorula toruloides TaxID=5286 RepID=A0A511KMF5_RHOTO|nr:hypothtical protein [Rhodotorula toruloides]
MLLRTKQTPEVEASQAATIASLPEPFASILTATTASSSSATPIRPAQPSASKSFDSLAAEHARRLSLAYDKILVLKEFNSENEQWDWKARVDLEEDEDGEKMQVDARAGEGKRAWTAQEVQAYLRTGERPDL